MNKDNKNTAKKANETKVAINYAKVAKPNAKVAKPNAKVETLENIIDINETKVAKPNAKVETLENIIANYAKVAKPNAKVAKPNAKVETKETIGNEFKDGKITMKEMLEKLDNLEKKNNSKMGCCTLDLTSGKLDHKVEQLAQLKCNAEHYTLTVKKLQPCLTQWASVQLCKNRELEHTEKMLSAFKDFATLDLENNDSKTMFVTLCLALHQALQSIKTSLKATSKELDPLAKQFITMLNDNELIATNNELVDALMSYKEN